MTNLEPLLCSKQLENLLGDFDEDNNPSSEDCLLLSHCLEIVRSNVSVRLYTLTFALSNQNFDGIAYTAHQLKGNFLTAGAKNLADLAEAIHTSANQRDLHRVESLVHDLKSHGTQFFAEIEGFIEKLKTRSPP